MINLKPLAIARLKSKRRAVNHSPKLIKKSFKGANYHSPKYFIWLRLLCKLKFRFDGKENSVTDLPKHLRNRWSYVKLSDTIRSVPYLTHNVIYKNFDRLALLYKIILQNSKTIPVLLELNHFNKYFQIIKI